MDNMPGRISGWTSGRTSGRISGRTSGQTSGRTSGRTSQPGQPARPPGTPARPRHARDTEAHVGAKNIDFPLVFQAKMVPRTGQHRWGTLHRALKETARTPVRQAVWGIYIYIYIK